MSKFVGKVVIKPYKLDDPWPVDLYEGMFGEEPVKADNNQMRNVLANALAGCGFTVETGLLEISDALEVSLRREGYALTEIGMKPDEPVWPWKPRLGS